MINPSLSLDFLGSNANFGSNLYSRGLAGKAVALQTRLARALITRTRRGGSLAVDISSGQLLEKSWHNRKLARISLTLPSVPTLVSGNSFNRCSAITSNSQSYYIFYKKKKEGLRIEIFKKRCFRDVYSLRVYSKLEEDGFLTISMIGKQFPI